MTLKVLQLDFDFVSAKNLIVTLKVSRKQTVDLQVKNPVSDSERSKTS